MNKIAMLKKKQEILLNEFYSRLAELKLGMYDAAIDDALKKQ